MRSKCITVHYQELGYLRIANQPHPKALKVDEDSRCRIYLVPTLQHERVVAGHNDV